MEGYISVVLGAAQDVIYAEEAVKRAASTLRSILERMERDLAEGSSMNSLGVLQGNGPDVAVATLEAKASAFQSAYRQMGPRATEDWDVDSEEWLDSLVAQSPRLTAIVRKLEVQ